MYTTAFKTLIFPALDRLNGTRIADVLKHLEETESYSREDLISLQSEKLSQILSWTKDNSPFYCELWARKAHTPRVASEYPELDGLPIITKEDLRPRLSDFPLSAYSGRVLEVHTSGSTGSPMTFYRSMEQESWFWALRIRMWQWAGYRLGTPYMAINLNPRKALKKRLQDLFFRCTYLTYNSDNQNSQLIVQLLKQRRILHINAFGSCLLALAQYMQRNGIANPGVEVLTSTGDNLYPTQRELIEKVFGVGVHDYYGAGGEGVHLASQCRERNGYHIHMENCIVEVICGDRPARPGETGRIVVTQLDNYAMPLIRYDLGDLATVIEDTPCACGREHPRLGSIEGRACDIVTTLEGAVLLPQFFFIGPFKMLEHVHRYQVVQTRPDEIVVKLVAENGCDRKRAEQSIADEIARVTNGTLHVRFEWVAQIELAGIGKFRPVISEITPR